MKKTPILKYKAEVADVTQPIGCVIAEPSSKTLMKIMTQPKNRRTDWTSGLRITMRIKMAWLWEMLAEK